MLKTVLGKKKKRGGLLEMLWIFWICYGEFWQMFLSICVCVVVTVVFLVFAGRNVYFWVIWFYLFMYGLFIYLLPKQ